MINDICCENPRIIRNPDLMRLLMIHRHYVCGDFDTYISDSKLFELQNKGFDRSFSPKLLGVNKDNINDFGVVTKDGTILPMFFIVPCGKCTICRNNKAMDWCTRCAAESSAAIDTPLFITLTYDNYHLPKIEDYEELGSFCQIRTKKVFNIIGDYKGSFPTLLKKDIQDFMKRLRRRLSYDGLNPEGMRYFIVGEYGSKTHRPHYHGLIWNFPVDKNERSDIKVIRDKIDYIKKAWNNGFIMCSYAKDVSGTYCMKYMKKPSNCPFKCSQKEFFLCSRKNGSLGATWLNNPDNFNFHRDNPQLDHITITDHTGQSHDYPMPVYFKRKLFPSLSNLIDIDVRKAIGKTLFAYQELLNIKPFYFDSRNTFWNYVVTLDNCCFKLNEFGVAPPSIDKIQVKKNSIVYKDAARYFKSSAQKLHDLWEHYWNIFIINFYKVDEFMKNSDFNMIRHCLEIGAIHKEFVDRMCELSIKKDTKDRLYQIEQEIAKNLINEIF